MIEQLLARLAPRPDVPSRLRKLPTRTSPPAPSLAPSLVLSPSSLSVPLPPSVAPTLAPPPPPSSSLLEGVGPLGQPVGAPRGVPGRLQPLSETRYRLQLTASAIASAEPEYHARANCQCSRCAPHCAGECGGASQGSLS